MCVYSYSGYILSVCKMLKKIIAERVFYLKMIVTIVRLSRKIDDIMFFDSSLGIVYIVFKILLLGFICFWVGVVLYSVYKSKWKLFKRIDIAKLNKDLIWSNFLKLFSNRMLKEYLIKQVYKKLFQIILLIVLWNTNIVYKFMGFLAMMASFDYLKFIFEQKKLDKKNFSLTYFMQTKITVNWFIKYVCIFSMLYFLNYIFLKYNILKLWFK